MNKATKWLVGLIAVLVIANIALVAAIWLKKTKDNTALQPPRGDARDFLVKELSLNTAQVKVFDSLRKEHFERIRNYQDEMRQLKDSLFEQLRLPRTAKTDSLAQHIGALQTKLDLETFEHFSALRSLLNTDQKEKFDNTIQEVLRTMAPRGGPPPPPRPGEGPTDDRPDGPRPEGPAH